MLTDLQTRRTMVAILVFCLASVSLFAAPPNGGGGNKVTVTAANPPDAFQGEELDIIVSGSGFDAGSQVGYLITGTTDASQVEVLSVQYVSDTELRTRIRPKDNAIITDYDIEVRTSSGRKGKGTTLFRVKQAVETTCTGSEPNEPTIVYLSALDTTETVATADLVLASDSGCDQYLLLKDAEQEIPYSTQNPGEVFFDVSDLRLDVEGDLGLVIWRDRAETIGPPELNYLSFLFDGTDVLADPLGPQVLYVPPGDWRPYRADVRIDDSGGFELVLTEKPVGIDTYSLVYVHIAPAGGETREVLAEGNCPILDASGACFRLGGAFWSLWSEDGSEVYFTSVSWPDDSVYAITRIGRTAEGWQPAQVLLKHDSGIEVDGARYQGVITYGSWEYELRKNGRPSSNRKRVWRIIDPDVCSLVECGVTDGYAIVDSPHSAYLPGLWTRDGGMLYSDFVGQSLFIKKYSNPLTGEEAAFRALGPIANLSQERDTSF